MRLWSIHGFHNFQSPAIRILGYPVGNTAGLVWKDATMCLGGCLKAHLGLFTLVCSISFSFINFAAAKSVNLARPLDAYANAAWSQASHLEESLYREMLRQSYVNLNIRAYRHYDEPRDPFDLSDRDQRTLIETELGRLEANSLGRRKGQLSDLQIHFESLPIYHDPLFIYRMLGKLYPKPPADGSIYSTIANQVYQEMAALPVLYMLVLRLHELKGYPSHRRTPQFWEPLLESAYILLRKELIHLDYKIKVAAEIRPEQGDLLATSVMTLLLSGHSPQKEEIFQRIFENLDQSLTLNVRANRYMTRLADWAHRSVLAPTRDYAYGASVIALLIGLGMDSIGSSIADDAFVVAGATGAVSLGLFLEKRLGVQAAMTGVLKGVDQAMNFIAATFRQNRRGKLSELAQRSLPHLQQLCDDLFEKVSGE